MTYHFHYNKNGKKLDSLDVYIDNFSNSPDFLHYAHFDFSYNAEGQISGYEENVFFTGLDKEDDTLGLILQFAIPGLPELASQKLANPHVQDKSDDNLWYKISVSFFYVGKNVAECRVLIDEKIVEKYSFTYTDYQNPFYKLFKSLDFTYDSYSPNLAKTIHYEYLPNFDECDYIDVEYEYEIEDNYPVKTTFNSLEHLPSYPDVSRTYTGIQYYEYQ